VTFDPVVFKSANTITLTTGELSVTDGLTISGPGATLVTVSGNNSSRVFNIGGPSPFTAAIAGLTITQGRSNGPGSGINSNVTLSLDHCIITGNTAFGASGSAGGIFCNGSLTITDCQVTNNSATVEPGGILGSGAIIVRTTISGNTGPFAGGLVAFVSLLMVDSTVSNNVATNQIGGIAIQQATSAVIRNCTISGNTAANAAGGIGLGINQNSQFNGSFTLQNCTVTNNKVTSGAGGGIARVFGTGSISVESSIISGNSATSAPDISTSGAVAAKYSAIGSTIGITTFFNSGGNLPFGSNLKLGPLSDNGGPTLTHLPAIDSPLLNAGSNPFPEVNDQRGIGFARDVNGGVDIGAIEAFVLDKTPPLVNTIVPSVLTVSDAQLGFQGFALTVTFNEPMNQAVNPTISFPIENPSGTLAFDAGAWLSSTQYQVKYDVEDLNINLSAIDVRVTGGKDVAGNIMATSDSANVFSIDTKNPIVTSIILNHPSSNNLPTVGWTVTFSEPVTGVNAGNFTLFNGGLGGAPVINSVMGGGTTWTVQASGYTGQGTLALYVAGTAGVTDAAGNPLAGLPISGPSYSIDLPPTVGNVQVNDGSAQRSRVTSVTVTFIERVNFAGAAAAAFTLTGPSGAVTLAADTSLSTPTQSIAKLTFSGANTDFTSLKDGRYTLKVLAAQVSDTFGSPLDGNTDGAGGDDYLLVGAPNTPTNLFRLFGDADGSGQVDLLDFAQFRTSFNPNYNVIFDFDGLGTVDLNDFNQFRSRFGMSV
jgi:parallel beta-helix repeat protein